MRVRHFPDDSRMARYWHVDDVFELCDEAGNVLVTWTGTQLVQILEAKLVDAAAVIDISRQVQTRDLYVKRRLTGQHKKLKMLPWSPHTNPSK